MEDRQIVLAEYYIPADVVILFVVVPSRQEPAVFIQELDRAELRRFVSTNFGQHNAVRDFVELGLEELWHGYDYLVAPVASLTKPDDIICIVPYGLLHYLPLHALRIEGRYLIERNPIVYCPSASILKYCQYRRKKDREGALARHTATVFGDALDNLPDARTEARAIAELFQVHPVLGDAVTRSAFQQMVKEVDIVHFAGHGYFQAQQPLESGLRLAGNEIVTARDVFRLGGLHASLVTLSGCETGINETRPGDELLGLMRAFLYAGTPSVMASLWRVSDVSTAFFMQHFYRSLRDNPTLWKVDALRQAMLATKAQPDWTSFYYWAPFVLIGDWQ